jgi:tetratricopeptide (TPR) repeat protein
MSDAETPLEELDARLDALSTAKDRATEQCRYRTACRAAAELRRLAKAERRLHPYIWSLFTLTNSATSMLDPGQGREAAVELIAVLESEDRARQIQPDLEPAVYERTVAQLSSCAYDNLGKAVALGQGYNSEGVHAVINEGIQICRRTGKLECIHCFRGYATDVFVAADDLEMALHHARYVAAHGNAREGFDRRWNGTVDETRILLLAGRLEEAEEAARRALELTASWHNPRQARQDTLHLLERIGLLKGVPAPTALPGPHPEDLAELPRGEYPEHDLGRDSNAALRSCLEGDYTTAIRTLSVWDRRLRDQGCLSFWFDVRLLLVAAHRLVGQPERLGALAGPLETAARSARDWLTLRRLGRLLDPDEPATPSASASALNAGRWAGAATRVQHAVAPAASPAVPAAATEPPKVPEPVAPPLAPVLAALFDRLGASPEDPVVRTEVRGTVLSFGSDTVTHPDDASAVLKLAHRVCDDLSQAPAIWDWAVGLSTGFPRFAEVQNLLASLGNTLRTMPDSRMAGRIEVRRIEELFRSSVDLDPEHVANFARAGLFHEGEGNLVEAERCLARGFRLARSNAWLALRLAQLYRQTERARDALAVLDMSLREGADDPEVAWQAAMTAQALEQYEVTLTYLDRVEELEPGRPWVNYYRASALLYLGRPEAVPAALDEEARRFAQGTLHLMILRACAAGALAQTDTLRDHLADVLQVRLAEVDYISHQGLVHLFGRLWLAAAALAGDDALRSGLEDRLLCSGLAPNALFEGPRRANPSADGLGYYICTVRQDLDDRWREWPGCLANEGDWTSYSITWGVLAPDEAEAGRTALAWQARCYTHGAVVEDVRLEQNGYSDHPGIVWQGIRTPPT